MIIKTGVPGAIDTFKLKAMMKYESKDSPLFWTVRGPSFRLIFDVS